ncbi:MAG: Gldg family protein [Planctomycetes bacterium]|nr:Gldg family protein [Planctomycetota bacterium]
MVTAFKLNFYNLLHSVANITALTRREILSMLVSPATYIVITFFVAINSLIFYLMPLQYQVATFEPMLQMIKFLGIFFVPLLTMKLFAEERRTGTIEILLTAPVRPLEIVIAKYKAAMFFYLLMLLPCVAYIALLAWAGRIDRGLVATQMLGLLLLGMLYVAVGLFTSSITRSQIAAAMGASVLLFVLWLLWFASGEGSTLFASILENLTLPPHFDRSFAKGVIATGDLVYFLTAIVFFLFLTWKSISMGEDAITGSREERLPSRGILLAVLGVLALEAGIVGVAAVDVQQQSVTEILELWQGGAYSPLLWVGLPFAMAILLGALALFLNFSWRGYLRLSALLNLQRLNLLAGGLALVVIIFNINLFAGRHSSRYDLTEVGLNSLTAETRHVLDALQEPVHISVFYTAQDQYEGVELLARTQALLEEYEAYSPRVLVEYLDPLAKPLPARKRATELGLPLPQLPFYSVVEYRGQKRLIPWNYIAAKKADLLGQTEQIFLGEQSFTEAIRKVFDPRVSRIYFSEGHVEYNATSTAKIARSAGRFARELKLYGYEVDRLPLMGSDKVPPDCDLLILAGPQAPFNAPDLMVLKNYLDNGGHAMFLFDPRIGKEPETGLEKLLKNYGIRVHHNLLADHRYNAGGAATVIQVLGNNSHEITAASTELRCYLAEARSLGIRSGISVQAGWRGEQLLQSSDQARALNLESRQSGQGPFVCAVAAEGPQRARIVVVGDADLCGNLNLGMGNNGQFLRSAVNWLCNREDRIFIPEREDEDRSFILSAQQRRVVWWVALVGLPQIFLLAGVLSWWMRRK